MLFPLRWIAIAVGLALFLSACNDPADDALEVPSTDIYLASLELTNGTRSIGELQNITNRDGYDNQPFFLPDGGGLLYTSMQGEQTDIFRYTIAGDRHEPLTRTEGTSEYSPTPLEDGLFSVVRVEEDGTQRLWRFAAAGGEPELLLPDVAPVGYHAWMDEERLALFVLGEPPTLQRATLAAGEAAVVAEDIGRSLQPVPNSEAVSFVQQRAEGLADLMRFDPATGALEVIAEIVEGGQDHAWTPDGLLLMTSGSVLYRFDPSADAAAWEAVADLSPLELSRIAVSPDGARVAFVGEE
ncbi:MAG: hypothetical protein GVY15_09010 [Bacteroidetes bacterium]|jgi:Tol biopolymer transport system component|nr:hypothetical protein [Bacteroidota bacterium]